MLDIGLLATVRKTLRQSNGRWFRKLPFYHGKKVLKCADGKDRGTSQKRGERKVLNLARYKVSKNCVAFKNLHGCKVI